MAYRPRSRIWTPAAMTQGAILARDLREHLRVDADEEEYLISGLSVAATSAVERWTQRLLSVRTAVLRLQGLPTGQCPVELPGGAVSSVTSVVVDGVAVTGCTAIGDSPAILLPAADWPTVTGEGYPVVITYEVGMPTVPQDLIHAIKMIAADMYQNRESTAEMASGKVMVNAEWLMAPHRIWAAA
jgi:uncharacterized phiE125 gp8 family phage protein